MIAPPPAVFYKERSFCSLPTAPTARNRKTRPAGVRAVRKGDPCALADRIDRDDEADKKHNFQHAEHDAPHRAEIAAAPRRFDKPCRGKEQSYDLRQKRPPQEQPQTGKGKRRGPVPVDRQSALDLDGMPVLPRTHDGDGLYGISDGKTDGGVFCPSAAFRATPFGVFHYGAALYALLHLSDHPCKTIFFIVSQVYLFVNYPYKFCCINRVWKINLLKT